jgi:hypothetical protein
MNKTPQTTTTATPSTARRFTRRIGSTTFVVAVHFNPEAKETASDKIASLIRNEAAGKAANL